MSSQAEGGSMNAYSLMAVANELTWFIFILFTAFMILFVFIFYGYQFIREFKNACKDFELFLVWLMGVIVFLALLPISCMYFASLVMIYFCA